MPVITDNIYAKKYLEKIVGDRDVCVIDYKFQPMPHSFKDSIMVNVPDTYDDAYSLVYSGAKGIVYDSEPDMLKTALEEYERKGHSFSGHAFDVLIEMYRGGRRKARRSPLTVREKQAYDLLMRGMTAREVADRMGVTQSTIHVYYEKICRKANMKSMREVLARRPF